MTAADYQSGLGCNVLVLNKHYMAIRIIGAKRAFSLLFRELAEVVSLEEGKYSNYEDRKSPKWPKFADRVLFFGKKRQYGYGI